MAIDSPSAQVISCRDFHFARAAESSGRDLSASDGFATRTFRNKTSIPRVAKAQRVISRKINGLGL